MYYVYILTNKNNTTFYIGSTKDIQRRLLEHKKGELHGFTKKYNVNKLVYIETHNSLIEAFRREKQLKNWHRDWKINLLKQTNPTLKDIGVPKQVRHNNRIA